MRLLPLYLKGRYTPMTRKGTSTTYYNTTIAIKSIVVTVTFALLFILCIIGDYAWRAETEKVNKFSNEALGQYSAQLVKVEKDTNPIDSVPVAGAEFHVYNERGLKIGLGSYFTDENGIIQVHGLKEGGYYFKEINPAFAYTFDTTTEGEQITRYYFEVNPNTADENLMVHVKAYNKRLTGSLTIQKTVENSDGAPLTQEQENTMFPFEVIFSDGRIYNYRIDGTGSQLPLASGDTLELRHGQSAVFDAIPMGVLYSVEEVDSKGYHSRSYDHQGTILEEGKLVDFTNTWLSNNGSLIISKKICEGPGPADESAFFDFTVVFNNLPDEPVTAYVNGEPFELSALNNMIKLTLRHNEQADILNLPVGTTYTVTEGDYFGEGYVSVPSKYTGQIISGTLVLPFVNSDNHDTSTFGSLLISKELLPVVGTNITEAQNNQAFPFTVTFSDLPIEPCTILFGGEEKELSRTHNQFSFTLKHGEDFYIEGVPVYVGYKVEEGSTPGFISGTFAAEGITPPDHISVLEFYNQVSGASDTASLTVSKVVEGEVPERYRDLDFHFVLEVDGKAVKDFSLKANESITIDNLPEGKPFLVLEEDYFDDHFALIGVINGAGILASDNQSAIFTNAYIARITINISGEKTWDLNGQEVELPEFINVDLKERGAAVSRLRVTPDEDGRWVYSFTVPKYDEDDNEIDYSIEEEHLSGWWTQYNGFNIINRYILPLAVDPHVVVKKTVIGEYSSEHDSFQFKLTAQNGAPMPEGAEDNVMVIEILGEGEAEFGEITYVKAGTYHYTITEVDNKITNIIYDKSVYALIVDVVENDGHLMVASQVLEKEGNPVELAEFINTVQRTLENGVIIVEGHKTWNHGDNNPANYPHSVTVIVNANGEPVIQHAVTATDKWKWIFRLNRYDEFGEEIIYTVDEVDVPGYTKTINGFNITNTYDPDGLGLVVDPFEKTDSASTDKGKTGSNTGNTGLSGGERSGQKAGAPQTSDNSNLSSWILLLAVSALGLIVLQVWRLVQKRRGRW